MEHRICLLDAFSFIQIASAAIFNVSQDATNYAAEVQFWC